MQALEDVKLESQGRHDSEANANLNFIRTFLETCAPALNYDGRQFYSQLLKFHYEYRKKLLSNTSNFANTIKAVLQEPPVYSLLSYTDCIKARLRTSEGTYYYMLGEGEELRDYIIDVFIFFTCPLFLYVSLQTI